MNLSNQRIILGITGGIAAYKAAELTRHLKKAGAEVICVMTEAAQEFVTPITLQALSGNPVRSELFDAKGEAAMSHIELARWADLVLIAPATADFLATLAHGKADNLLSTVCLATSSPIAVAPAMNQQMWAAPSTAENLATLARRGIHTIGPASGEQACGDTGLGRMEEAGAIAQWVDDFLHRGPLQGKRVLITAGPTREAIDPVRFLSNRSSGKMGFAMAQAARKAGAEVTVVAGPVALPTPSGIQRIDVESALEMHTKTLALAEMHDIFIATAAVADYRPKELAAEKIKKSSDTLTLELVKNPDILRDVALLENRPFCLGFAAETHDLERFARAKLQAKKLDMLAANAVNDGKAFDKDDNALHVFWPGDEQTLPTTSKPLLAEQLIALLVQRLQDQKD